MIYGNLAAQAQLRDFFQSSRQTMVLTGPAHLGKASFARELGEALFHPSDLLLSDPGVDGVREIIDFCKTSPLHGEGRLVVVDEADGLSIPAQDALLKLLEEPNPDVRLVVVSHDAGRLTPALRSRIRDVVKWGRLSDSDMVTFAESVSSVSHPQLLELACGLPGMYSILLSTVGMEDFYHTVRKIAHGPDGAFLARVPDVVQGLKSRTPEADAVAHLVRLAVRTADPRAASILLRFCSSIVSVPSLNPEIHWSCAMASLSVVT